MSEREEVVLCGASAYNKKFYLNQDFKGLPDLMRMAIWSSVLPVMRTIFYMMRSAVD